MRLTIDWIAIIEVYGTMLIVGVETLALGAAFNWIGVSNPFIVSALTWGLTYYLTKGER